MLLHTAFQIFIFEKRPLKLNMPRVGYYPNGAIRYIVYRRNDRQHRVNGPSLRRWNNTGMLVQEEWRINGRRHRDGGPARQKWRAGVLVRESWWKNGRWHRDDGPAYRQWHAPPNQPRVLIREEWRQNNRELSQREIELLMRPLSIMTILHDCLPQPIYEELAAVYIAFDPCGL